MASASAKFNVRNPAVKRILQEIKELQAEACQDFVAEALEEDIFEWHFVIRGPPDTEFEGGIYHGRILLPAEYPFKPPAFMMLTPNGRFQTGTKICLSISSHHPEHWQPSWSVRTALTALIAFMPTPGQGAIGSLDFTKEERQQLAIKSVTDVPKFGSAGRQKVISDMHTRFLELQQSLKQAAAAAAGGSSKEGTAAAAAAAAAGVVVQDLPAQDQGGAESAQQPGRPEQESREQQQGTQQQQQEQAVFSLQQSRQVSPPVSANGSSQLLAALHSSNSSSSGGSAAAAAAAAAGKGSSGGSVTTGQQQTATLHHQQPLPQQQQHVVAAAGLGNAAVSDLPGDRGLTFLIVVLSVAILAMLLKKVVVAFGDVGRSHPVL